MTSVDAIQAIKKQYKVNRNWTWSGDPCTPGGHTWDGLDFSYSISDPPGITSVRVSKRLDQDLSNLTCLFNILMDSCVAETRLIVD